jgi:hypothetical protein
VSGKNNKKILPIPETMQGISTSAESKEEKEQKKKKKFKGTTHGWWFANNLTRRVSKYQ